MKGEAMEGCLESHEYLRCADETWWSLPIGSVNKESDNMGAFVGKLKIEKLLLGTGIERLLRTRRSEENGERKSDRRG